MEDADKKLVENMIKTAVDKAVDFPTRKRGDTPTDVTQLTPKGYVDNAVGRFGIVLSDGTAGTPFPTGWTTTYVATGDYRVNHNLGTTKYAVLVSAASTLLGVFNVGTASGVYFEVLASDLSGVAHDAKFSFQLLK